LLPKSLGQAAVLLPSALWGGRSAKRIGWGATRRRVSDDWFDHTFELAEYFDVCKPQNQVTIANDDTVACLVVVLLLS
jgi:hypothetical protein